MPSRHASHAGSWYSDSGRTLTRQLDGWLGQVPDTVDNVGSLPVPGARVIIAPYVSCAVVEGSYHTDQAGMPVMRTRGRVLPMHTRRWTSPKRENLSLCRHFSL